MKNDLKPYIPDADSSSIPTFEEIDEAVVNECGYDSRSGKGKEIFDNVIAESTDEKIFTLRDSNNSDEELKQSFNIEDTITKVLENESFDRYWRKTILDNLDTEKDKFLLEQIDDAFIGNQMYRALDALKKLEVLYYPDFFRNIVSIAENEDSLSLVQFDDEAFNDMPNVMRLY